MTNHYKKTLKTPKQRYRMLFWGSVFFIALVCGCIFLVGYLLPRDEAVRLFNFSHYNLAFFAIRYSFYAMIYFSWERIALTFNPNASAEKVKAAGRQIAVFLLAYELFFGLRIVSLLGNLFGGQ